MRWTEEQLAGHLSRRDQLQHVISAHGFAPKDNPKEDVEHLAVARYLTLRGVLFMHCPNEGKRSRKSGAKLKALGMSAGFPDLILFDPPPLEPQKKGVAIELKRAKGRKATPEQIQWINDLRERGWIAEVVHGANAAIELLRSLGWK